MSADRGPSLEASLFLALTRHEPEWRDVTLDLADPRPGGWVLGGEPTRLTAMNLMAGAEVGLPANMSHVFVVHEGPPAHRTRLPWMRRHRASRAADYVARAGEPVNVEKREEVNLGGELALRREEARVDDEVVGAVRLLDQLSAAWPGPWELARVVRSPSGGLWAFGLDRSGDLAIASQDVEARRADEPPRLLWVPGPGVAALDGFLVVGGEAGLVA